VPSYREESNQRVRDLIAAEQAAMTESDSVDSVLARLREHGANPIEAIKVVESIFDLRYPAGKIALSKSPAWGDSSRDADELHDAAESAARELADE
jgi:hypothetical protein